MVSVFPVNLEYLQFVNLDDPAQKKLVNSTIDAQLAPLAQINQAVKNNTLILGTVLWECNTDNTVNQNFQYFQKQCQLIGVRNHFLVGPDKQSTLSDFDNCTFIDFNLLRTFNECYRTNQKLNTRWYPENKKFLFLMGKSFKPHRIGLLYKFYKQGMLTDNQSIWSYYDNIPAEDYKTYVPDASLHDLNLLIKNYKRLPDQIKPVGSHYGGFPFDLDLYKNTNLSVVSENHSDSFPYNTEKIYRTILNHHPFVIAGSVNHTEYLNSIGFETFDQYFSVPNYGSIVNLNSRLDAIVENVKLFDPGAKEIQQIHFLTQKNFQRAHELADHYTNTINQMFASYNITVNWSNFLFRECSPYYLTWQFYYQTIKDSLWPPCDSIEDCINLPEQIQNELKTVFKLEF